MSDIVYSDRHGNIVTQHSKAMYKKGAFALILFDGNVLMVKPSGPHDIWELPGGGLDSGEWVDQGLKRELYEETGIALPDNLELKPVCKLLFHYYPDDVKQFWNYNLNLFVLEFKLIPIVSARNEIERVEWKPFSQLDSLLINFMHRTLIRNYQTQKDVPVKKSDYDDVLGYI
ncbi:MAG: NUDIX domain-containing protein [Cyclobacteriaceae bacterium]